MLGHSREQLIHPLPITFRASDLPVLGRAYRLAFYPHDHRLHPIPHSSQTMEQLSCTNTPDEDVAVGRYIQSQFTISIFREHIRAIRVQVGRAPALEPKEENIWGCVWRVGNRDQEKEEK